jgi:hypothetical protein
LQAFLFLGWGVSVFGKLTTISGAIDPEYLLVEFDGGIPGDKQLRLRMASGIGHQVQANHGR